ncbi:MAG: DUF3617 family protein [Hyphomonadaceae bacterium]
MRRETALGVMLAAMLGLAACSGGDPATGGESVEAPPVPVVPAAPPPAPAPPPPPKGPAPGRWQITTTLQGLPGASSMTSPPHIDCLRDQISLAEAHMRQAQAGVDCSGYSFRQEGTSVIGSYTCTAADGSRASVEATTSGDMMRAYTTTVVSTTEEPKPGMPETVTVMVVAERLGDCDAAPPPILPPPPAQ